jgi:beta-lactam-binding protein with PASTA domain
MREPTLEELIGLTLEEAIALLVPQGWKVDVHRYEDGDYDIGQVKESTISLDIQDGKVYDFLVFNKD